MRFFWNIRASFGNSDDSIKPRSNRSMFFTKWTWFLKENHSAHQGLIRTHAKKIKNVKCGKVQIFLYCRFICGGTGPWRSFYAGILRFLQISSKKSWNRNLLDKCVCAKQWTELKWQIKLTDWMKLVNFIVLKLKFSKKYEFFYS
jgi:hypothetical protein